MSPTSAWVARSRAARLRPSRPSALVAPLVAPLFAGLLAAALAACGGGGGGGADPAAATGSSAGVDTGAGAGSASAGGGSSGSSGSGAPDGGSSNGDPDPGSAGDGASGAGTAGDSGSGDVGDSGTAGSGSHGPTWVVGTAALPAGATRVATMQAVPWTTLPAGSRVLVSPGHFAGVTTIQAQGTAAAPIVVTAIDPANPPVLADSVDFRGAAWVQLSHLVVASPTFAGIIVRQGSHHLTVADNTVTGAPIGINVTDGAGTGHQLLRNTILDTATQGINLEVNADPAERTLVQGNDVERSGQHGIELRASHYQVDGNRVTASGLAGAGATGIHVYSGSAGEDSGDDNLIRWNRSWANVDRQGVDGNGIEVDQWCDGNVVAYNVVWGNDGAGIIVYDGSGNSVRGNTAYDDGHDSGHTHVAFGELILSATAANGAAGNQVADNLLASTRAGVPAFYIDSRALADGNTVRANWYSNAAGGTIVRWGDGATRQTTAAIDGTANGGSVVALPAFVDAADPLDDGLRLALPPLLPGLMPPAGDVDMLGTSPQLGGTWFGAYFTPPSS